MLQIRVQMKLEELTSKLPAVRRLTIPTLKFASRSCPANTTSQKNHMLRTTAMPTPKTLSLPTPASPRTKLPNLLNSPARLLTKTLSPRPAMRHPATLLKSPAANPPPHLLPIPHPALQEAVISTRLHPPLPTRITKLPIPNHTRNPQRS